MHGGADSYVFDEIDVGTQSQHSRNIIGSLQSMAEKGKIHLNNLINTDLIYRIVNSCRPTSISNYFSLSS